MSIHDFVSDYTGAFPDRLKQLLLANTTDTASTWTINDLWMKFFTERGFTSGSLDDRMRQWLLDYTGATVGTNADLWALITEPFSEGAAPTDLLDLYPGALMAYSTGRRLRDGYTGALFRVRRSSDNAEQDIGFVAETGLVDTSALTTFVGAGNGFVTTLYDHSTSGWNFTQTTAGAQPRIVAAGVVDVLGTNSVPTMVFGGSAHLTRSTDLTSTSQLTLLFAASRDTDTGGSDFIISHGNTGTTQGTFNCACPSSANGDILWRPVGGEIPAGIGLTIGTAPFPFVALMDCDTLDNNSRRRIRVNAGAFTTSTTDLGGLNFTIQTTRLGGGSSTPSFIGKMSEFILWPDDDRAPNTDLDSNLMTFYGIT